MNNCVSYEIALQLKEAGFPEPHQLMSSDVEVWAYGMSYTAKLMRLPFGKEYDYIFAPTISDILPLTGAEVYASHYGLGFICDTMRINGEIFRAENIHDAAALAWLHQNKRSVK
jgi:hypothetical protein